MYMHSAPENSKISRYESLKQVEKSTGKTPPELRNTPKLSDAHNDVWQVYTSLVQYSYQEIAAYTQLTGIPLQNWEIKAIIQLSKYREVEPTWPPKSHN
jgi:hypothetical protein